MARRFSPPWTVRHNDDAYWVEDVHGNQFGFCYYRDDRAGIIGQAYYSRDEARRLAAGIARLPELLKRP
jgi:hypothetical protein